MEPFIKQLAENTSSATKQSDYNTYNANQEAQKQAQYNEANSLQESHENTEKHMQYQTDSTINNNVGNTNWDGDGGGNPYYCCGDGGGYSSGDVAGAAALGAVGGMAVGMVAGSAMNQPSTTTIINNPAPAPYYGAPAPAYGAPAIGSTVPYLPPGASTAYAYGATFYYSNGTFYQPMEVDTRSLPHPSERTFIHCLTGRTLRISTEALTTSPDRLTTSPTSTAAR